MGVPDRLFPHEMPRSWLTSGQAAMTAKLRRRFLMLLLAFLVAVGFAFWRKRGGLWVVVGGVVIIQFVMMKCV